ncbi:MAG: carboxypeptidase-like regulatory domain-containing protein, partial [Gemmatimonadaceae bacterium]
MEKQLPDRQSFWRAHARGVRAACLSAVLALALSASASAQQIAVTGTVITPAGTPLPGVLVRVSGTDTRALTSAAGRYFLNAPANGSLNFTVFGYRPFQAAIGGRARIDVTMSQISYLEEVVVTAYTEQRRADITGAVASINVESAA